LIDSEVVGIDPLVSMNGRIGGVDGGPRPGLSVDIFFGSAPEYQE
jgi:hypothetical protein